MLGVFFVSRYIIVLLDLISFVYYLQIKSKNRITKLKNSKWEARILRHSLSVKNNHDVLILILRLLSSHDLLNLSYVCERFDRIAADETLWKIVDTRDSPLKVVIWYRKKYKIVWQHFKFHTIIFFFCNILISRIFNEFF